MSKQRSRPCGAGVAAIWGLWLASACATTTKPLAPSSGGAASYKIECIKLGDCWTEAKRACGGPYRTVAKHENTIPESELPGLNVRTQGDTLRHYPYGYGLPGSVPQYGPGVVESDEPMPLAEVVVVCTGG
jgi:hypothetical protein